MPGQRRMDVVDLAEGVADAGTDGLAGSFGLITQPAGAATEPGRSGQCTNQVGALGAECFGAPGVAGVIGVLNYTVQPRTREVTYVPGIDSPRKHLRFAGRGVAVANRWTWWPAGRVDSL